MWEREEEMSDLNKTLIFFLREGLQIHRLFGTNRKTKEEENIKEQQGQAKGTGEEKHLKRHQHEKWWEKFTFFA